MAKLTGEQNQLKLILFLHNGQTSLSLLEPIEKNCLVRHIKKIPKFFQGHSFAKQGFKKKEGKKKERKETVGPPKSVDIFEVHVSNVRCPGTRPNLLSICTFC